LNDKIVGEMSADVSLHVSGSFPSPLYKGFEEKYARLFLEQGSFIMRSLCYYHKIEDSKRKDRDEGEGRVKTLKYRPVLQLDGNTGKILSRRCEFGPVNHGILSVNPRYIFCLSGPQVDVKYLANQYDGYVVCINQPDKLVRDIASYLEQHRDTLDIIELDCVQVRYDKNQLVQSEPELDIEEKIRMSYGQKDPKFSDDCEYRLVLTLNVTPSVPTEIKVELRKKLEYAEMVHLQTDN